ncbi:energy-coupling factor transporter transmembrane component T family protein [Treponema sp. R6D11]
MKSFKPMLLLILFTGTLNLFLTPGEVLWSWGAVSITAQGISMAITMLLRLFLLMTISGVLTYTTSPIALSSSMEAMFAPLKKFKFPAHEVAMMMSIALRFIPTLIEEVDIIVKAQTARGANFNTGSIIKRIKALIPLLLPLFISAFRRADDLAVAMEARCYRGGEGRTSYKIMKYGYADLVSTICVISIIAAVIIL